jgi:urease accessory protein
MLVANEVRPHGTWNRASAVDTVVLDFDGRHRRRHAMKGRAGLEFLLDLPQVTTLREGDALVLSDGRTVCVEAASEQLMEIAAPDPVSLLRIAWHLGNRHTPTQIMADRLRIRDDHVLKGMLEHLGSRVSTVSASFDPETGAYIHGGPHEHGLPGTHDHHRGAGHGNDDRTSDARRSLPDR